MNDKMFKFMKTDGGYILTSFNGEPTVTEVITPSEYNGLPVVEIRRRAFERLSHLQKIRVSEGVRRIGDNALRYCTSLRSISLPASLEDIGDFAFGNCEALREVEFKSYPKFGGNVFSRDSRLPAEIALMGAVRSRDITRPLGIGMLRDEIKLANDTPKYIPWFSNSGVVKLAIENDCFRDIDIGLLDKLIDYSLKKYRNDLAVPFLNLKSRKFGFTSEDLDKIFEFKETDGGYILTKYNRFLHETEITTPSEYNGQPIVEIGSGAFVNSCSLQKVAVSEGVRSIGADAFSGCKALRSVILPSSLKVIGSAAFCECKALCEVEFKSYPKFGGNVFRRDPKLPADITLMGRVRSRDITRPLDIELLRDEIKLANGMSSYEPWFSRTDVVALAAENGCFRDIDAELLDALTEYSVSHNKPELTAYFLDLKRRKFGFTGGDPDLW